MCHSIRCGQTQFSNNKHMNATHSLFVLGKQSGLQSWPFINSKVMLHWRLRALSFQQLERPGPLTPIMSWDDRAVGRGRDGGKSRCPRLHSHDLVSSPSCWWHWILSFVSGCKEQRGMQMAFLKRICEPLG